MKFREILSLRFVGWYLLIPPVFSPMGEHHRSFNDLSAPLNKWDIWARFDSRSSCEQEKEHLLFEALVRLSATRKRASWGALAVLTAADLQWPPLRRCNKSSRELLRVDHRQCSGNSVR